MMPRVLAFLRKHGLRWGLFGLGGLIAAGLLSGLLLTLAPGRALVAQVLDGRQLGSLGQLEVEGIQGNVLANFTIDQLTLSDADGPWLVVDGVRGDWDSLSALLRPLVIENVSARRVQLLRRPQLGRRRDAGTGGGAGLPELVIRNLSIDDLSIAPGVAGPAGRYHARGEAVLANGGVQQLSLASQGLDQNEDRIDLNIRREAADLRAVIRIDSGPYSPITHLLRLQSRSVSVLAELDGDIARGDGQFSVLANGADMARGQLDWVEGQWTSSTVMNLGDWAVLGEAAGQMLGQVELAARGRLDGLVLDTAELTAGGAAARITRDGAVWRTQADVEFAAVSTLVPEALSFRTASLQGQVEMGAEPGFRGALSLAGLGYDGHAAASVQGPVEIRNASERWQVDLDLRAEGVAMADARLAALTGSRVELNSALSLSSAGVEIDRLRLDADALALTAQGRLDPGEDAADLTARLEIAEAGRLHPELAGPLVVDLVSTTPNTLDVVLAAEALTWPTQSYGLLDGLTARLSLERDDKRWTLSSGTIASSVLELDLGGQADTASDWQLDVSGAVDLAALEGPVSGQGGLAINARAISSGQVLRLDAGLAAAEVELSDFVLENPEFVIQSSRTGAGEVSALWGLRGAVSGQGLDLSGAIAHSSTLTQLDISEARWGDVVGTGQLALENERLAVTLSAVEAGNFEASLHYHAPLAHLMAGQVEGQVSLPARLIPGGSLAASGLRLSGRPDHIQLDGTLAGALGADFRFALPGHVSLGEDGVRGQLNLSGRWGQTEIRAVEPVPFALGPAQTRGVLQLGAGELAFDLSADTAQFNARDIPADLLGYVRAAPDLTGLISARLQFERGTAHWQGGGEIEVRDLTARHDATAPVLQARTLLQVDGFNRIETTVSGEALDLYGLVEEGDGALTGRIRVDGEIAPLAELLLPPTVKLSGALAADLVLDGQLDAPRVNGLATLTDGQVLSGTYGASFQDVRIEAEFSGDALNVPVVSMTDGGRGQATGTGAFQLGSQGGYQGAAELDLTNMRLLSLPELDMVLSGQTRLTSTGEGWQVSGQSTIEELRVSPRGTSAETIPNLAVTEINLPDGRARSSYVGPEVVLDYRVTAEDGIRVAGTGFDSEWSVDLTVGGRLSRPTVSGTANLKDGEAYLLSRPFDLTSGEIRLDGDIENARVQLAAKHERADLTVEAQVAGPVDAPQLTLASTPELPQDEILSRLLFGRDASDLSAFETAQIAAQLSGYSMFNLINELRDRAGVDRLRITSNADGTIAVTGGHQISDDVYLEIETAGLSAVATTRVEWSLTPDLSLLSRISDDTDASVSLRWRREFD
ncbi:MAG: translocation/assembly module TamB domain-containing protein [Maricaulis sp.]|uniref:translocation/assembly module TamB domain-containing protein n=1 Tax=Maricaulis sp. TaxID=1486257 RepID=UPI002619F81A|nr:translocation/assembly module TamB domain-containing protein [Maricaulis sp.]MDM7984586.1 translocation/assembly module TamB domain-containing protein [Maricaulis sp.]